MKIAEDTDTPDSAKFSINSSYQGFTNRQKNIFDQLNIAEHNSRNLLLNNNASMDVDDLSDTTPATDDSLESFERKRNRMRQFQGKESIFKKPQARPPRGIPYRRVPDYQIHPHKWTRYSLGDVKSEDMSERANAAAAMSFLKEMELRKSQSEKLQDTETPHKIVFKKVSSHAVENKECPSVSSFRNSKVIMPEYVVGQKKVQKRKEKKIKEDSAAKEIRLGHLEEDQDGEEV